MVLYPDEFHASKSLHKNIKKQGFMLSFNCNFDAVIAACASARQQTEGTWISPDMQTAYTRLHELGLAHSLEVSIDNELVGGLYGVCLGGVFFGESMFSHVTDASKTALFALSTVGKLGHLTLIDCQVHSDHLERLGAKEIPRKDFESELLKAIESEHRDMAYSAVSRGVALEPPVWQQILPNTASELLF